MNLPNVCTRIISKRYHLVFCLLSSGQSLYKRKLLHKKSIIFKNGGTMFAISASMLFIIYLKKKCFFLNYKRTRSTKRVFHPDTVESTCGKSENV